MRSEVKGIASAEPGPGVYVGLGLVAAATLMLEILLTRIFSVTMWYHFAFMAVSIAMFGLTVGGLLVFRFPRWFPDDRLPTHLARHALALAGATLAAFVLHLRIRFRMDGSWQGNLALAATYVTIAVPFVFAGVVLSLALSRFPRRVGQLYAADLLGSAAGCLTLVAALGRTDGPTVVVFVAWLAAAAAVAFVWGAPSARPRRRALLAALAGALLLGASHVGFLLHRPLLNLRWVKGRFEPTPLFEKWNSFSRVTVTGDPDVPVRPFAWGYSPRYHGRDRVRQLRIDIDAAAATFMLHDPGDLSALTFLKYDITNLPHYLRPGAETLVVGAGGGRDVLSALVFEQPRVVAVELNPIIDEIVNVAYARFSGGMRRRPGVEFVVDEARGYIARRREPVDLIQLSLIDTYAATAAGAFALTENPLYTVEAWSIFLSKLRPGGLLAVTRWYFPDRPVILYRLTALAAAALARHGVEDPRGHVALARTIPAGGPLGVATLLVGRDPFSPADLKNLNQVVHGLGFEIMLSPETAEDAVLEDLASGPEPHGAARRFPANLRPPTDDAPFIFNALTFRNLFDAELRRADSVGPNLHAVVVLAVLLVVAVGLTAAFILLPLALATDRAALAGSGPRLAYFTAIGLGFILVEIAQMQRLTPFLGHPSRALTVVLFTLLVAGGLGSLSFAGLDRRLGGGAHRIFLPLMGLIVLTGLLTPWALATAQAAAAPFRIALSGLLLFPLGFLMGMPFPWGIRAAAGRHVGLLAWFWGLNGAASVLASVLAVGVAIHFGISRAYWVGAACYAAAWVAAAISTGRLNGHDD